MKKWAVLTHDNRIVWFFHQDTNLEGPAIFHHEGEAMKAVEYLKKLVPYITYKIKQIDISTSFEEAIPTKIEVRWN